MARLGPLIDHWLAQTKTSVRNLAERARVPERRIYAIRRGYDITKRRGREERSIHVEFDTADKLLTAMGRQEEWYRTLLDLYQAPEDRVVPPAKEVPE